MSLEDCNVGIPNLWLCTRRVLCFGLAAGSYLFQKSALSLDKRVRTSLRWDHTCTSENVAVGLARGALDAAAGAAELSSHPKGT